MLKHKVKEEILKVVGELITHLKVDPTKIICLFLIGNNGSHEKVGWHIRSLQREKASKQNLSNRILYWGKLSAIFQKWRKNKDFFRHTNAERIHHQQNHAIGSVKGGSSGRRSRIPGGILDLQEGMKNTREGTYIDKFIRLFTYYLNLFKRKSV